MDEPACPGPHQFCRGCRGAGDIHSSTLYVSHSGIAGNMTAPHRCAHCHGRGFFCKQEPPCWKHDAETPVIGPDALPPV